MKSAIHVGNKTDVEGTAQLTASLIALLEAGHSLRVPEQLQSQALAILGQSVNLDVSNLRIEGCHFTGTDNAVTVQQPKA